MLVRWKSPLSLSLTLLETSPTHSSPPLTPPLWQTLVCVLPAVQEASAEPALSGSGRWINEAQPARRELLGPPAEAQHRGGPLFSLGQRALCQKRRVLEGSAPRAQGTAGDREQWLSMHASALTRLPAAVLGLGELRPIQSQRSSAGRAL